MVHPQPVSNFFPERHVRCAPFGSRYKRNACHVVEVHQKGGEPRAPQLTSKEFESAWDGRFGPGCLVEKEAGVWPALLGEQRLSAFLPENEGRTPQCVEIRKVKANLGAT